MKLPVNSPKSETVVKASRFISQVFPLSAKEYTEKQQEARQIVKHVKQQYSDARHIVHAFIIGTKAEISGCSDDGEPSGTAGRPVLEVLKGSGFTNILLTVTRYFGGTLLGTGGLVKAYTESAKNVLQLTNGEELIDYSFFKMKLPYELHSLIKKILEINNAIIQNEDFSESIVINAKIDCSNFEKVKSAIFNGSQGRVETHTYFS